MKRYKFNPVQASEFFNQVEQISGYATPQLSSFLEVSARTIRDWRKGRHSVSALQLDKICKLTNLTPPKDCIVYNEVEWRRDISKLGGLKKMQLYGPPGTVEGRSKGGKNSLLTHLQLKTNFRTAKPRVKLEKNINLAEYVGICLGDGNLTNSQVKIYTDANEVAYHSYINTLTEKIFKEVPSSYSYQNGHVLVSCLSGINLIGSLNRIGLKTGNKMLNNCCIPPWIFRKHKLLIATLRGLFDTDGCVFQDKHKSQNKTYSSLGIAFTMYSPRLFTDIQKGLNRLHFHTTTTTKHRIMIRKKSEVLKFFETIKPANSKHVDRFKSFLEV